MFKFAQNSYPNTEISNFNKPHQGWGSESISLNTIPQGHPEIVTRDFDSIASLMNGGGPRPVKPADDENDGDDEIRPNVAGSVIEQLFLRDKTVLRRESFGGIIYNSDLRDMQFLNRPMFEIFQKVAKGQPLDSEERSHAAKLPRMLSINPGSAEIINYPTDIEDALNYPITATIELTYSCHNACRHCMNSSAPNYSRSGERSLDYWLELISQMRSEGLFHIYFSGGEIIRYPWYKEIFSACDELGIRYLLVSDLAAHTEKDFENLATCKNLDCVRVSLDGHNEATHDYMRGAGRFDATIRGIQTLLDMDVEVGIYHSVHRGNIKFVDRFLDFSVNLGIRTILPGVACAMGRGSSRIEALNNQECDQLSRIYLQYIREGTVMPIHGAWRSLASSYNTTVFETWRDFAHGGTHRVHLTPDGSVRMCPKLENTRFSRFGTADKGGISEAWRSPLISDLRRLVMVKDGIVGVPLNAL